MKILDTGNISIGIRNIPSEVVYFSSNKEKPGFCYEIATEFAKYLGVNPEFKIVDGFSKYFENTIFNSIDMIADIITITEERSKTLTMIKFVENVEILIGRKDEEITNISKI
ncbi:hypothetical protein H17ap60334_07053 [Thermosipho africanus H17ap60334]|jgi:membrane-bound lytic murein transglycosylase MltF|uniref:transporter substrate-binding domain-containing protein n=1 Tax=Thermosipho TaxID=2420 RepID=UPI00028D77C5|nr:MULTISPECIES: transporter substrate-binding domain-containing protein [Thermosipho]HCF38173.1 hypothetical protein [Thermosipho africanus]EKF49165.1 hypothetical protein H17ap60334_07053 [Thermosipho africanus H17ap60334]MBZ4649587.1 hypothetical protein [Thermosipho sp. (in: thermotogales)]MDK2839471.1 hypothetical protein [Thermosipho sp. (in: thermotogales)]MDK2899907.1 hypothetical protein [Thermosipho sp. (in: thermotogales)]